MALVDYTYFQQRLVNIPSLKDSALEQLNEYIETLETKYLDIMLGVKMRRQFLSGLDAGVIEQRWLNLRDGLYYEVSGEGFEWKGFSNSTKESPIANYIFCHLTNDNQLLNTGIGEVKKMAENSIIVTPQYRISAAWNEATDMNKALFHFLYEFETDYLDWEPDHKRAKSLLNYDYNIGL